MRVTLGDEGTAASVDITGGLVGAIAHALWQARGGDSLNNWAEAETVLDQLLGGATPAFQSEMKPSTPARVPPAAPAAIASARKTTPRR